eukprot:jgi/Galph1/2086/GphlegSOOS_G739.1
MNSSIDDELKKEEAARAKLPPVFSKGPADGTYSEKLTKTLKRLDELIDWERRDRVVGTQRKMRVNTGPIVDLLERLGHPEKNFQTVHITGSKGKGSVTSFVASALYYGANLSAGWYSSPHVERINERIGINEENISDDELATCLEQVLDVREEAIQCQSLGKDSTWFDIMTSAGFLALSRAQVEWAVVECGLGGRLDSTNVLQSPITVLTNVELEHAEIIGPTRKDIAREKAGIAHKGSVLITGISENDEVNEVIKELSHSVGFRVIYVTANNSGNHVDIMENNSGPILSSKYSSMSIEAQNIAIAKEVLEQIGLLGHRTRGNSSLVNSELLDMKKVLEGAKRRLPARMERFLWQNKIPIIIDGAHVPGSIRSIMQQIARDPSLKHKILHVVLGMGRDKHVEEILDELYPYASYLYCTCTSPEGPYLPAEELEKYASKKGFRNIQVDRHCIDAFHSAIATIEKQTMVDNSLLLVTGSLHLAGALRPLIRQHALKE